ncbi:MAG: ABC transporter substrate-binding protein [Kiloniellales bacterium]|nr:ABC transporter substrate-binding protein [Kiloniellales bacterium]
MTRPHPRKLAPRATAAVALAALILGTPGAARAAEEPPLLAERVAAGELPPMAERLPETPFVGPHDRSDLTPGRYGGTLRLLMGGARDVRQMVVYGYARLVGYRPDLTLAPDILKDIEVEDNRIFTLHLRRGHRWSDGAPFTSEDFRYWWEEVANNDKLFPAGPPVVLRVHGELPEVEYPSETTVRYTWPRPNPTFLDQLAKARPLYIYAPAHYLKQFHANHADAEKLEAEVAEAGVRNWAALHIRQGHLYKNRNPDLPSLQPWINTTRPPSERFVFKRNPYFHRVDRDGRQLPYIDKVVVTIADKGLIPAKTGAGDSDLQARYLRFDNYTFLKEAEKKQNFEVRLWDTAVGSRVTLFPNLNVQDQVLRKLFRDVRFRRALSLGINRDEINQTVYFGLGQAGNNTLLSSSPLFDPSFLERWAHYDPEAASALLDEIGLNERNDRGVRLLSDGRPLELIVESAGIATEESDVLELIRDSWRAIGIKLFTKPLQREVFVNRIFAGETQISVSKGLDNGIATADMSPAEFVPITQDHLQWPKWGQYHETRGRSGQAPDMPAGRKLMELYTAWYEAADTAARRKVWRQILEIHADQVFTLGTVSAIPQPVVVNKRLRNLPKKGIYSWYPGSFFGTYRLDHAWLEPEDGAAR